LGAFDRFRRTTPDMRAFVDQFEHHVLKLSLHGHKHDDATQTRYLISKADLPQAVESELMLSLHRIRMATGKATSTYTDVKNELILMGKSSKLFVRVNKIEKAPQGIDAATSKPTPATQWIDARPPQDSAAVRWMDKGKGKGLGKNKFNGRNDQCWHYQQGTCFRGTSCRFAHGDKDHTDSRRGRSQSRNNDRSRSQYSRSRSPRGYGGDRRGNDGGRDRSRSRGAGVACRDYANGNCNRGKGCRFAHQQSSPTRSPSTQRRFAGSAAPASPRFGRGSASRSPMPRGRPGAGSPRR
jgi:hypothetical protein